MDIHKKLGLSALALALSCVPLHAQQNAQQPPPNPAAPPDNGAMMAPGAPGGDEFMEPGAPDDATFDLALLEGPGEEFAGPGDMIGPEGDAMVEPDGPRGPGGPGGPRGEWGRGRGGFERGGHGRHGFGGLSRLLSNPDIQQKVGISAAQVAKIREQESTFRKNEIRQRAEVQIKQIDLRDLLSAEKPDRAAIDRALQDVSTSRLAMEKSRIDFRLNMRDALTPDQKEKLKQALKDRRQSERGPGRQGPSGNQRGGGPAANPNRPAPPAPANPGE
jgi:Spy/CpxP family protein refolding chaperone